MPTRLLSQSEAFTGMTALRGSSISMQFLGYLKNLTPLCENKPEMTSLARIRLRYRKQPRTGDLLITGGEILCPHLQFDRSGRQKTVPARL